MACLYAIAPTTTRGGSTRRSHAQSACSVRHRSRRTPAASTRKKPEPSLWVAPEATKPRPHLEAVGPRIYHEHRITPRLALVVAVAREQAGVRTVLPTRPAGPELSLRGRLHARCHRKGLVLLRVGRKGIEDELRRGVDAGDQLLCHDGLGLAIFGRLTGCQRNGKPDRKEQEGGLHNESLGCHEFRTPGNDT